MSKTVLSVSGLSKHFSRNGRTFAALDDVSFDIARGETLALVGPSGSGKSTVARLVLRLIEPDSGEIHFQNKDFLALGGEKLRKTRSQIQMVFQDPLAAFNPRATVARVLDDPLRIHKIADRSIRSRMIGELLDRVGLTPELSTRAIHEISGGQRQRVAIARAIATKPALIVLDEAVSALDVSVRAQVIDLLLSLQKSDGIAYLFISHDLGLVRSIANRAAIMEQGRIVETGDAQTVISNPQSSIGKALVAAAPRLRKTQNDG